MEHTCCSHEVFVYISVYYKNDRWIDSPVVEGKAEIPGTHFISWLRICATGTMELVISGSTSVLILFCKYAKA